MCAVWLRRQGEYGKADKFSTEENAALTSAFEEMVWRNGAWFVELKQSGLQVDFLAQEVRMRGQSPARLELEWDATQPTPYTPDPSQPLGAEETALLDKGPGAAQYKWLWWSG
jgi:hypothetical protein